MLIRTDKMESISYSALMELYRQSNLEIARGRYPRMAPQAALWQAEQDFWFYLREDFFPIPGAVLCLWQPDEVPVSSLRLQPWADGLLLTGLETHPDHRGRGYATALLRAALSGVREPVYSHVRKENTASLALHRKQGFQVTPEQAVYLDGTRDQFAWTLRLN